TGATAHIKGDMPLALVDAYKTWNAEPKPPFDALRNDFIVKSEVAFTKAQARFYLEVNDKTFSPVRPEIGQFVIDGVQRVLHIHPSLSEMFNWRKAAWDAAANDLQR